MRLKFAESLQNCDANLKLTAYQPFGLFKGELADEMDSLELLQRRYQPQSALHKYNASLSRQQTAYYVMQQHGELELEKYEYLAHSVHTTVYLHEKIQGNFWLLLNQHNSATMLCLPYRQGTLITETQQWRFIRLTEPSTTWLERCLAWLSKGCD